VNHLATPEFWFHYRSLPAETRELADRWAREAAGALIGRDLSDHVRQAAL
jgi:hypothetical protein